MIIYEIYVLFSNFGNSGFSWDLKGISVYWYLSVLPKGELFFKSLTIPTFYLEPLFLQCLFAYTNVKYAYHKYCKFY